LAGQLTCVVHRRHALQAAEEAEERKRQKADKKAKKRALATLSFGGDDDAAEDDEGRVAEAVVVKRMKNPNVATDFLPDRARDADVAAKREELKKKWTEEQVSRAGGQC